MLELPEQVVPPHPLRPERLRDEVGAVVEGLSGSSCRHDGVGLANALEALLVGLAVAQVQGDRAGSRHLPP